MRCYITEGFGIQKLQIIICSLCRAGIFSIWLGFWFFWSMLKFILFTQFWLLFLHWVHF